MTEAIQSARSRAGRHVEARIHRLLAPDPAHLSATAAAQMAELRRGVGKEPGSIPALWGITLDGLESTARSDEPTRTENAVHHALTLFAIHQQSRSGSMHDPTVPFGTAVRRMADILKPQETAVHTTPTYRRFTILATASSLTELTYHARGLISQLRQHQVPLAYGALADDLVYLQIPDRAPGVRRRWARDFFRVPASATPTTSNDNEGALS